MSVKPQITHHERRAQAACTLACDAQISLRRTAERLVADLEEITATRTIPIPAGAFDEEDSLVVAVNEAIAALP